jgi:AcrR family transcriptional regulator
MPTSTFYNLPVEKREKLITAIKGEFTRVPFEKVSINKIIQEAGIPRGSFYQYFADKNDMLQFILCDYRKQTLDFVKNSLLNSDGDIFSMILDYIDFTLDFAMSKETNNFCRNLFADIGINFNFYLRLTKNNPDNDLIEDIMEFIRFDKLDIKDPSDCRNILEILLSISREAVAEVFIFLSDCETIRQKYSQKIALLKRTLEKSTD